MPITRTSRMNPVKINDTTYEVTLPRGDKVEIGEREAADFKPHLKLNRWGGECSIKVGLPTTARSSPVIEGEKVKWVDADIEACFYPLEPTVVDGFSQNELGGFEFEIILKKKPQTNQIVLNMETQGLKFYYQPELTLEEIALGCIRPANVVGSYAVYHATRTNMHRGKADADKYKAGKAFHIYRPKVIDASGKEVWADLHIDNKLTITIDQVWLDAAVYPISIDPNFGYESIAGSSWRTGDNYKRACKFTAPGSGTATSVTVYTAAYDPSTGYMRGFIYSDSGGQADALLATGTELLLDDTFGWEQSDLSTSITEGTPYWLGWMFDHVNWYFYDAGDTGQVNWGRDPYADGPSDPFGTPMVLDWVQSIYCTYEAGGGETYDETGREQVILAVTGGLGTQTMQELGKVQAILAEVGETEHFTFPETGKEQVILAVGGQASVQTMNEPRGQVILAVGGQSGKQTMTEARGQVIKAELGKAEHFTFPETGKEQVILAVGGQASVQTMNEPRGQVILAVGGQSGKQTMTEARGQVIKAELGKADIQTMLEARGQVILAEQGHTDLAIFAETGHLQAVLASLAQTDLATFSELAHLETILAVIGESDLATFAETSHLQVIIAGQGESDLAIFSELGHLEEVLAVLGEEDTYIPAGVVYDETGHLQAILFMAGESDNLRFTETGKVQAILVTTGESDTATFVDAHGQVILVKLGERTIRILKRIRRKSDIHNLGRMQPNYNLGTMQGRYTLGEGEKRNVIK